MSRLQQWQVFGHDQNWSTLFSEEWNGGVEDNGESVCARTMEIEVTFKRRLAKPAWIDANSTFASFLGGLCGIRLSPLYRELGNVTSCQCQIYCLLKLYRFQNMLAVASKKEALIDFVNKLCDSTVALKGRCDIHFRRDLLYNPNSTTKTPGNCLYHI